MLPWVLIVPLSLSAPPGASSGADGENALDLDERPESADRGDTAEDPAEIERHVAARVPSAPVLRVARGSTIFVEAIVPLPRGFPVEKIEARLASVRAPREVRWIPSVEIEPFEGATPNATSLRLLYALRVSMSAPEASPQKVAATIQVRDLGAKRPIATMNVQHALEIVSPNVPALQDIDLDRRAYLLHQRLTMEAYAKLKSLHGDLRYDRVDAPPPIERIPEGDLDALKAFLRHRLRADIALTRLRVAADLEDATLQEAAVLAIGSLSKGPSGSAERASAIQGETIERALDMTERALDDLRVDEAEGYLKRLRKSGRLDRSTFARWLTLFGAVDVIRARRDHARAHFGQAICIRPDITLPLRRLPISRAWDAERTSPSACTRPIAIERVTATRRPSADGGTVIVVRADLTPDPHHVVSGGDIELWGSGGEVQKLERVRAIEDAERTSRLEASFADTGMLENYAGELLIKVFAREVSGIVVASHGDPDPISTPIGRSPELSGMAAEIPSWVWYVAAGVAAVGAATAGVVLLSGRETKQGIGPIIAEF